MKPSKNVFVSYALSDKAKVRSILTQLQKQAPSRLDIANVQGQVSTRLDPRRAIQSQIEKSDEVVVLWTKDGAASSFVNYEAAMADAMDKPITVILTDRTAPKLPEALQGASILRLADAVKARPRTGRPRTVRARSARTVLEAPVKKRH
jgi:hypothetical protein